VLLQLVEFFSGDEYLQLGVIFAWLRSLCFLEVVQGLNSDLAGLGMKIKAGLSPVVFPLSSLRFFLCGSAA